MNKIEKKVLDLVLADRDKAIKIRDRFSWILQTESKAKLADDLKELIEEMDSSAGQICDIIGAFNTAIKIRDYVLDGEGGLRRDDQENRMMTDLTERLKSKQKERK